MKPASRLINTSRGQIVDHVALLEALATGQIAGVGLDVYDVEPLENPHPLRELPNVLATPHIGYVSKELYHTFYSDTVRNIVQWLDETGRSA
jgi:phosphoglycerate dehydrogenase-like enzyme